MPRTAPRHIGGAHYYSPGMPFVNALQCNPVHSNLPCPSFSLGAGTLGRRAGAETEIMDRRARVSHAGVGVGGVRRVLGGSRRSSLQSDDFAGTLGGSCFSSGLEVHAGLSRPQSSATTSKKGALRVPIVTQNVNRKLLNPGIAKNRKWEVFQTVNHSRTMWDPRAKPKGLLGQWFSILVLGQWRF